MQQQAFVQRPRNVLSASNHNAIIGISSIVLATHDIFLIVYQTEHCSGVV
jgi:hypothetical protein